mmetsp:Transcript_46095/g.111684  ORF Transcript_46095/g.111684 Transcript_46095/m.111684 type:complete len:314 (-) Transcript_46095:835-1776(-)
MHLPCFIHFRLLRKSLGKDRSSFFRLRLLEGLAHPRLVFSLIASFSACFSRSIRTLRLHRSVHILGSMPRVRGFFVVLHGVTKVEFQLGKCFIILVVGFRRLDCSGHFFQTDLGLGTLVAPCFLVGFFQLLGDPNPHPLTLDVLVNGGDFIAIWAGNIAIQWPCLGRLLAQDVHIGKRRNAMRDRHITRNIGQIKVHNHVSIFFSIEITKIDSKGAITSINLLVMMDVANLDAIGRCFRRHRDLQHGTLCHDGHDATHGITKRGIDVGIVFDKVVTSTSCSFGESLEHVRVVVRPISETEQRNGGLDIFWSES